jgi:hypothetical protein
MAPMQMHSIEAMLSVFERMHMMLASIPLGMFSCCGLYNNYSYTPAWRSMSKPDHADEAVLFLRMMRFFFFFGF